MSDVAARTVIDPESGGNVVVVRAVGRVDATPMDGDVGVDVAVDVVVDVVVTIEVAFDVVVEDDSVVATTTVVDGAEVVVMPDSCSSAPPQATVSATSVMTTNPIRWRIGPD